MEPDLTRQQRRTLVERLEAIDSAMTEMRGQIGELEGQLSEHERERAKVIAQLGRKPDVVLETSNSWAPQVAKVEDFAPEMVPPPAGATAGTPPPPRVGPEDLRERPESQARQEYINQEHYAYRVAPVEPSRFAPAEVFTYARVYEGTSQVHLLPRRDYPDSTPPAAVPALCGRRSSNAGPGNERWFVVYPPKDRRTVDLCAECVLQLDQRSRTR